jgi:transcriptional regulator with XRE-family HTH domain
MSIGFNIKLLRMKNKMTQKQLAELLQVEPNTIARYENGKRNVSAMTLKELSRILKCDINEFYREVK